jgi:hypothetical protein
VAAREYVNDAPPPLRSVVGQHIVLQWADDLVAIGLPDTPRELQHEWEEKGYTFVRFASAEATWPATFARLLRLLAPAAPAR